MDAFQTDCQMQLKQKNLHLFENIVLLKFVSHLFKIASNKETIKTNQEATKFSITLEYIPTLDLRFVHFKILVID